MGAKGWERSFLDPEQSCSKGLGAWAEPPWDDERLT